MNTIRPETFDIISMTAGEKEYHPNQKTLDSFKEFLEPDEIEKYAVYDEIDIPLGQSRYGGCVIDIPANFPLERSAYDYPAFDFWKDKDNPEAKFMRFAAQLNLADIAPYDKSGLLPKTGHLYFFADIYHNECHVVFADVPTEELERIIVPHEDNFYAGRLIQRFQGEVESFAHRFRDLDEDELEYLQEGNYEYLDFEKEDITADNKVWSEFHGEERSKIFGIFTHCQWNQEEIEEITFSDQLLLLQIGQNEFNEEGVFSVTIPKEDLKNRNFENCNCFWAQT